MRGKKRNDGGWRKREVGGRGEEEAVVSGCGEQEGRRLGGEGSNSGDGGREE